MQDTTKFYIDGDWVAPAIPNTCDVINPATEEVVGQISLGSVTDVDRAVRAARSVFPAYSVTSREERLKLLQNIMALYEERSDELARTITLEMGSPLAFSKKVQVVNALANFRDQASVLETYQFEQHLGSTIVRREPIGVCGLITPWNWPLNQLTAKLAAALAAGCTVVLKPSEIAPLSASLLAQIMHDAGVPKGVFNLVHGEGGTVGQAIAKHADIDMVSFTGSTRAGIAVAQAAAPSVKRVAQELGGKSPNVILLGADLEMAVPQGVMRCFRNTGQSCQAPTRMIVHHQQRDEVIEHAVATAKSVHVGDPLDPQTTMGPLASKAQFEKVQGLIERGIEEGATLVCGGPGRPAGFDRGYFVQPTIFADVTNDMAIAREEIFGPVLCIMNYDTEEEAVAIANDTPYGLAGYVQAGSAADALEVATRIRAGRVYINGAQAPWSTPFGGFKQSGNGREKGVYGLEEYLEVKAVIGFGAAS